MTAPSPLDQKKLSPNWVITHPLIQKKLFTYTTNKKHHDFQNLHRSSRCFDNSLPLWWLCCSSPIHLFTTSTTKFVWGSFVHQPRSERLPTTTATAAAVPNPTELKSDQPPSERIQVLITELITTQQRNNTMNIKTIITVFAALAIITPVNANQDSQCPWTASNGGSCGPNDLTYGQLRTIRKHQMNMNPPSSECMGPLCPTRYPLDSF